MKLPTKAELAIPVDRLHDWFDYDAETGSLKWKVRKWTDFTDHRDWIWFCGRFSCREAGTSHSDGYRRVGIQRKPFRAHRIIWALQTGSWPAFELDHINHDRADNRWENLRAAPGSINDMNQSRQRNNTSGVTGVYYHKRDRKWRAQVKLNGKHVFAKCFATKAEAISAVLAARKFHKFHPNHGQLNS